MHTLNIKNILFFSILVVAHSISKAQSKNELVSLHEIDSLKKVLKNQPDDSNKVNTLTKLSYKLQTTGNYDSALRYAKSVALLAEKIGFNKIESDALNGIGNNYFEQGKYPNALEYYYKALTTAQENANKRDIARALGNIGNIYLKEGNYPKALEYYFKALNIAREIGNKQSISSHLSNIGVVYEEQGNYSQALDYNFKSLTIAQEIGDKYIMSHSLDNIGVIYENQKNYSKALEYQLKSLATRGMEMEHKSNLIDIGNIYADQGNYSKALEYYFKALSEMRQIGDKDAIANLYSNVGGVYTKLKNYKQAKIILDSALTFSIHVGDKIYIKDTYLKLSVLDSAMGNYKVSCENYEKYIAYRDSLINQESVKRITQMEMSYRLDSIIAEQDKANIIKAAEIKRKSITLYSMIAILLLTLISATLLISRQQIKRKKDKIIFEKEKQGMEDELKNAKTTLDEYLKNMMEKNELLEKFKFDMEEVKILKSKQIDEKRIEQLEYLNKTAILTDDDWNKFKELFEQVYKGFFIRLKEKLPDLTQAEIRFICLTKLKLDTKQMASVLAVSFDTIKKSRYRLRKKLQLSDEYDVDDMIASI